jgi:hypothetical protein
VNFLPLPLKSLWLAVLVILAAAAADPLASVTLHPDGIPGNVYWATANDVTLGMVSRVPEPASWGMSLAGLGLVGFAVRRRAG